MARREERVDTELLARLESGAGDKIRVNLPNKKINEMFAIADQSLAVEELERFVKMARVVWHEFQERCEDVNGFEREIW